MKKITILMMLLVLTISMMAGCGCRNSKPAQTIPTTMPTVTAEPTTEMTTMPSTAATEPTENTIQDGNGPISTDTTTATQETGIDNTRSNSGASGSMTGRAGSNGMTGGISGDITGGISG